MTTTKKTTPSSSLLPLTLALASLTLSLCGASLSRCPEGHYRAADQGQGQGHVCLACSACPVNQIIRRPCAEASNTLCGPFSEFYHFHQAPRPSLEAQGGLLPLPGDESPPGVDGPGDDDDDPRESDDNRSRKVQEGRFRAGGSDDDDDAERSPQKHKHQYQYQHQRGSSSSSSKWHHRLRTGEDPTSHRGFEDLPEVPDSARAGGGGRLEAPSLQNREEEEGEEGGEEAQNQWKVLALALIVVLCVVCIFLIVFVFVVCYMRSRRAHLKQALYGAEHTGGGSHSGRGGPANPRPFQALHYVPVLTHAQPRAGTSGGAMVAPHGGLADSSYLYSEEYDADNSGQTISTTKSSDYVYFKSPHNGNDVYDV